MRAHPALAAHAPSLGMGSSDRLGKVGERGGRRGRRRKMGPCVGEAGEADEGRWDHVIVTDTQVTLLTISFSWAKDPKLAWESGWVQGSHIISSILKLMYILEMTVLHASIYSSKHLQHFFLLNRLN